MTAIGHEARQEVQQWRWSDWSVHPMVVAAFSAAVLAFFAFLGWLAIGVSDLKSGQAVQGEQLAQVVARLDRMEAAQADQGAKLDAGIAENRALLLNLLEGRGRPAGPDQGRAGRD